MKYAIPLNGETLSQHFGQSTKFMILDTDEAGNITGKRVISTQSHGCHTSPAVLASEGVSVVLAGGMGLSPRLAFESRNINVVLGVIEKDPEKAVLEHVRGNLNTTLNACEHGDRICDHGHH